MNKNDSIGWGAFILASIIYLIVPGLTVFHCVVLLSGFTFAVFVWNRKPFRKKEDYNG